MPSRTSYSGHSTKITNIIVSYLKLTHATTLSTRHWSRAPPFRDTRIFNYNIKTELTAYLPSQKHSQLSIRFYLLRSSHSDNKTQRNFNGFATPVYFPKLDLPILQVRPQMTQFGKTLSKTALKTYRHKTQHFTPCACMSNLLQIR